MKKSYTLLFFTILIFSLIKINAQNSNDNNCKVIGKKHSGIYNGGCKKGLAHGEGVLNFDEGKKIYEGKFKKGELNGEGILYTFEDGEKVILKEGIWKNNEYVGEKKVRPYKVKRVVNLPRYTVRKTGEQKEVYINFMKDGGRNNNVRNLNVLVNNGNEINGSRIMGYDNIIFPFQCEINYYTTSKLGTTSLQVRFEIIISEPGRWEISLFN
ncbi:MAG: hypothetical protein HKO01_02590 [Flaviramulus sp.]|nr:hypothetical protein [Flaviramulus sp.]NNC49404.1 hypothetical protein [Flaviramulus sp.]